MVGAVEIGVGAEEDEVLRDVFWRRVVPGDKLVTEPAAREEVDKGMIRKLGALRIQWKGGKRERIPVRSGAKNLTAPPRVGEQVRVLLDK
jgi:hypothetical protein